jgi:hypothetical protein
MSQEGRDADTVKRVHLKHKGESFFIITIVEHESQVNYRASLKMLRYISLVLDNYEKEVEKETPGMSRRKDFEYPPVLPIVFYDGHGAWTAKLNFADKTRMKEVFARYIPSFEYELVALNKYSIKDIMGFRDTLSVIMSVDKLPRRGGTEGFEKLLREYISTLLIPENLRKLMIGALTALLDKMEMPEEKIAAITDTIEKKEGAGMFDEFVAGVLEERQLAREEEREKTRAEEQRKAHQSKLESARKMKVRGYPDEEISDILSLPVGDISGL